MQLKSISIKKAIKAVAGGEIFLPPIQRDFVWQKDRIEALFDSLCRNYPIGNCIFWKLTAQTARRYPLYEFVLNYSENKLQYEKDSKAPRHLFDKDVYAVVDGQQRLTSFLIGLSGTYTYKKTGKGRQNVESNFVKSKLYLNLMAVGESADEQRLFRFVGDKDAEAMTIDELWFEVGKILDWKDASDANLVMNDFVKQLADKDKKLTVASKVQARMGKMVTALRELFEMLHGEHLYYFEVDNQNLDDVVNIFIRVNSGAMVLKQSDLLFSILVNQWNDGRSEIKGLIESMKESGVDVNQDFVLRSCIVLSDLPVKYKLESFTTKNISKIKDNWSEIKDCLLGLCDLLPELGYVDNTNLSNNALIPIAYYMKIGGNIKTKRARENLQKYYVLSQVTGAFSGQSDQVLEKIRSEIRGQVERHKGYLDYSELSENVTLSGRRSLKVSKEDVESLVEDTRFGSPHVYFLLSLLYPTVDFKIRKYEVDHIHPRSKFNNTHLKKIGIEDLDLIERWKDQKDSLPNLELLGRDNQQKGKSLLTDYLNSFARKNERTIFLNENLLPNKSELWDMRNFDDFYEVRRRKLIAKLCVKFGIKRQRSTTL